jgi:hypothetical protein
VDGSWWSAVQIFLGVDIAGRSIEQSVKIYVVDELEARLYIQDGKRKD